MATLINLNDTIPAAPAAAVNVKWQSDALSPTNVSAYVQVPLSALSGAIVGVAIGSGNNNLTWEWGLTSNNNYGLDFTESIAATAGVFGTQGLILIETLAGSTAVPLSITNSLTGTQTLPALWIHPTWNTSGSASALLINITDTASNAASKFIDFQISGTSKFKVLKSGNVVTAGTQTWNGSSSGSAEIGVAAAAGTPNKMNLPTATGTSGYVLTTDGGSPQQLSWAAVTADFPNQTANTIFSGPTSGGAAGPTFRAMVSADIPSSVALAGSPTTTTQAASDSSTKIATTAQVQAAIVASTGTDAAIDLTAQAANIGASTLLVVGSSGAGQYRISTLVVETTAASVSSVLPNAQVVYTDKDTSGSVTLDSTPILGIAGIGQTDALTANTVGTTSSGVVVINVKASTTIQYQTVNYASTAAGMQYALHIRVEYLG